ncbi:Hypothetical protein ORPV_1085 [Orpheovirus IHUMI-LCC2]|uniref:Uncharacterized protein n=1 Tax=Orpheovirus IHUMI-LCC2 TaxID=2023057 RepID=A0A2I2L6A3_9VIRU|nr:Hypothetical protein ORPV_1085 [Orpheovirus IHUMI-LCC2]SNW62989.1 Hypothetical protein ORPV_1085 [Orpheovirus IHUMI-LCC2]
MIAIKKIKYQFNRINKNRSNNKMEGINKKDLEIPQSILRDNYSQTELMYIMGFGAWLLDAAEGINIHYSLPKELDRDMSSLFLGWWHYHWTLDGNVAGAPPKSSKNKKLK